MEDRDDLDDDALDADDFCDAAFADCVFLAAVADDDALFGDAVLFAAVVFVPLAGFFCAAAMIPLPFILITFLT